jgi:3-dehydroquinate synthase class II
VVRRVSSRADVEAVAALAQHSSLPAVIMDATDWQSIPAENLVAAFQVCTPRAFVRHPPVCVHQS